MLVFNEAYYPGWWARVNGQTWHTVEANGFIQAVPVPAGDVTVEILFYADYVDGWGGANWAVANCMLCLNRPNDLTAIHFPRKLNRDRFDL